jgi:putative hydrolase of the HAD superfamily
MGVRAVIVDIGGVLEDTPVTGWIARWERRLGLESGGLAEIVSVIWKDGRVGQASLAEIEHRTATSLALDPAGSQELWADVWTEYLGTLNADLLDFFADLRPQYKTGILSNSFVGAREREQELYGFEDAFDMVMYSHEEGLEKPAARFYLMACERLGVDPHEVVFVDDLPENIEGAALVGMQTVLFASVDQAITDVRQILQEDSPSPSPRS